MNHATKPHKLPKGRILPLWGISVARFSTSGGKPLFLTCFSFLIQVPFDVCASENRTSQEEGLAPALTDRCVNPLQHTNPPLLNVLLKRCLSPGGTQKHLVPLGLKQSSNNTAT